MAPVAKVGRRTYLIPMRESLSDSRLADIIDQARGTTPADLVIKSVGIFDLTSGEIATGDIAIAGDRIVGTYETYTGASEIDGRGLVAVPGCYPTAAQLSLKPLIDADLLDLSQWPVINATSGVSGAGRKAAISNSFCEVSLQPYGVFTHRHQPEIASHLGAEVIFTPHLGNFPRGILETITCRLKPGVSQAQVADALQQAYGDKPMVRLYEKGVPALKNVVGLPFCDIGFAVQGEHLIVVATEDNLLKGAAAQAVQCANIRFGFAETQSLI